MMSTALEVLMVLIPTTFVGAMGVLTLAVSEWHRGA